MVVDILTKPLQGYEFTKFRDLLLGHNRDEFPMKNCGACNEILPFFHLCHYICMRYRTSVFMPICRLCVAAGLSLLLLVSRCSCECTSRARPKYELRHTLIIRERKSNNKAHF